MNEWVESSLAQLASFQKGRKVDTLPFDGNGFAPYLGASGLEGGDDGFADARLAVIAKNTDTLMLWDGERSGLVGFGRQGVVASTVSKLSPSEKIEPKYLYYALSERFDWIQHRRTGTGVPHVPKDLGRLLKLRYPKQRAVQQRIATILTGVDTAIEKTEVLIAKYQQIKAGLMHDLFTRGVLPNGQLRPPREQAPELYQETEIGWIPSEWGIHPLDVVADVLDPNPSHRNPIYHPEGFPFISTVEFTDNDEVEINTPRRVIAEIVDEQELRCKFSACSIGFSRKGTIGEIRFLPSHVRFALLDSLCVINPKCIEANFLFHSLRSECLTRQTKNMTMGQALPQVSIGRVRELLIPMPAEAEQTAIGLRVNAVMSTIKSESEHLRKLQSKKSGLMHDLLTGKVPVTVKEPEVVDG